MYSRFFQRAAALLSALLFLLQSAAGGRAASIRLRNEVIDPDSGTNRAVLAGELRLQTPSHGLFLIQFAGPLDSARRTELRGLGVDLLRYVPADAFIARLNHVAPATLGALKDVRWVGPYRAEHKIHPRLAALAATVTNQPVGVNILVSALATPAELAAV